MIFSILQCDISGPAHLCGRNVSHKGCFSLQALLLPGDLFSFFYQVFFLSFFSFSFLFLLPSVFFRFFCQVLFSFFLPGGDLTPLHNKPFQDSCCLPCCRGGGEFIELPAEELSTIDRSLFHILVCILCVFVFVYLFPHMSKSLLNSRRTCHN